MRLVIFDCDGTLVDSQHTIAAAMEAAFCEAGLAWPGRERTLSIVGLSLKEAMQVLVPDADAGQLARLADAYRHAFFQLRQEQSGGEPLYEGCREVLELFHARDDTVMAIATGKSQRGVRALLERERLEGYFQSIQTADDAPSKPHPAMIMQAIAETGAIADDTVMVGDTSFDMAMAREAQVAAIGVTWGYHHEARLADAGAHHIINHFNHLPDCVERCFGGAR